MAVRIEMQGTGGDIEENGFQKLNLDSGYAYSTQDYRDSGLSNIDIRITGGTGAISLDYLE